MKNLMTEVVVAPAQMSSEVLGQYVSSRLSYVCQKLTEIRPYVEEVWRRIEAGEEILGCRTKIEFSERILHRTYSRVRHMLAEENTGASPPAKTAGLTVFNTFFNKTNALVPYWGDGVEHTFVQLAEKVLTTPICSEDVQTVELIIGNLREAAEKFLGYAEQLESRARQVAGVA